MKRLRLLSEEGLCTLIADAFGLGDCVGNVVPIGYEDVNVIVEWSGGRSFFKVFAQDRTVAQCGRYVDATRSAIDVGVRHPPLVKPLPEHQMEPDSFLARLDQHTLAIGMTWIAGPTLYEDRSALSDMEVTDLVEQVALLQRTAVITRARYDRWALQNLECELNRHWSILGGDRSDVEETVRRLRRLPELPERRFVHGDLVPTNLIRGADQRLHVIDFGRCDTRPRSHEAAVVIAQTLLDPLSGELDVAHVRRFVKDLIARNAIDELEVVALPSLVAAVSATYVVGAHATRADGATEEENWYWLMRSRTSLASSLALDWGEVLAAQ